MRYVPKDGVLAYHVKAHRRHCVVSLLSTSSNQEDLSRRNWKIVDWDVKNQIKRTNMMLIFFIKFHE